MKIGAYIAFFFGIGNLILGLVSLSSEYADQAGGKIGFGISAIYFVVDVAGGFGDFGEIKP